MGDIPRQDSDPFSEKYKVYGEPTSPAKVYIPSRDPEKSIRHDSDHSISCGTPLSDRMSAVRVWENMPTSEVKGEGLAKILLHLSATNPLVAFLFCLYSIFVTILILIFGVVRSFGKDGISIKDQIIKALAPAIRYELQLIKTDINLYSRGELSPGRLLGVLVASPLVAVGIMVAAWTAATFWMYTTILGEPNQKQGKEIDGRSAARWVKLRWESWLLSGL